MFVTVTRIVMIMLVRMCELLVGMFMSVLLMWILRSRARGMRMLMMRVVGGMRMGVCYLVVGVRMRMISHMYLQLSAILCFFATHRRNDRPQ